MEEEHDKCLKEYEWGKLNGHIESMDKQLSRIWKLLSGVSLTIIVIAVKVLFFGA